MGESRHRRMISLLLFDPFGIIGLFFLMLGFAGVFIYGILVAYEHISIYNWTAWAYPLIFVAISLVFLWIAFCRLRRRGQAFIRDIKKEERELEKKIKQLEAGKGLPEEVDSSEFGINNLDIELENMVKEVGGFVPALYEEIKESPFSDRQALRSLAKLSMLEYIRVPRPEKKKDALENYIGCMSGVGLKITLTPKGLDALELPRITFATKVPEDIALMMVHARMLYRDGKSHMAILKCYNVLERALKTHLIPAIDDHAEKWNEHVRKKTSDEKEIKMYAWKGSRTIASLNDLWNFYKKNSDLSRRWTELTDRVVKYTSREEKEIKKNLDALSRAEIEQKKEMGRISDRMVDVVADVRSAYAHDKPSEKYDKDAYRILTLTELVLGVLFEDFKENAGIKSGKL